MTSDNMLRLARRGKRAGMTRDEFIKTSVDGYKKNAEQQGWRPAELAMALASVDEIATKVWPSKGDQNARS